MYVVFRKIWHRVLEHSDLCFCYITLMNQIQCKNCENWDDHIDHMRASILLGLDLCQNQIEMTWGKDWGSKWPLKPPAKPGGKKQEERYHGESLRTVAVKTSCKTLQQKGRRKGTTEMIGGIFEDVSGECSVTIDYSCTFSQHGEDFMIPMSCVS